MKPLKSILWTLPGYLSIHLLFYILICLSIKVQRDVTALLQPYFAPDNLVAKCLEYAATQEHIMDFTRLRALGSLFSMLNQG